MGYKERLWQYVGRHGSLHPLADLRAGLWCARRNLKNHVWRVVSLEPAGTPRGRALLSYRVDAYYAEGSRSFGAHTNFWETTQIARTYVDLGFAVDVIHYENRLFEPTKRYDILVDCRYNLERLGPVLGADCLKIWHADTSHVNVLNAAETRRLVDLQERRGVSLCPTRLVAHNRGIESADCATVLGNDATLATFRFANKPLYPLSVPTLVTFPFPGRKPIEACRRNFLWFGSNGMVHKGLDLTLEAFTEMPECRLYVCGPVHDETGFVAAYRKELFATPNIETIGWVDVESAAFKEILDRCIGIVFPSCSEGQAGSVATSMQAGLIPIVSRETGLNVDGFGEVLEDCSVRTIKDAIRKVSCLPGSDLATRIRASWEHARAHHTQERYAETYRATALRILGDFGMVRESAGVADSARR